MYFQPCQEHNPSTGDQCAGGTAAQRKPLQRTWNQFKQAAENIKPKKVCCFQEFDDFLTSESL